MITLTTDFGLKDPYVAEMKAVILGICPNAVIIDITHEIEKFNIRMGAYVLASAAPYFPDGSIHVAVVDPGVGTRRRPIVIQTKQSFFVGPDNGLLVLAAEKQGILRIHELTNPRFMLPKVSNTFHGRDIFAPVAAGLSLGISPFEFGEKINSLHLLPIAKPSIDPDGNVVGQVYHIDRFGNLITNIKSNNLHGKNITIEIAGRRIQGMSDYYEQEEGIMAVVGSSGYLEICLRDGSACDLLDSVVGDEVRVIPAEQ